MKKVLEIRNLVNVEGLSLSTVADKYLVTPPTIWRIAKGVERRSAWEVPA